MTQLKDLSLYKNVHITDAFILDTERLHNLTALDLRETSINGEQQRCCACWPAGCGQGVDTCSGWLWKPAGAGTVAWPVHAWQCVETASLGANLLMWLVDTRFVVLFGCPADSGLAGFTALVNLRVLRLKPLVGQATGPPLSTSYPRVRELTQLRSLTMAVPALHQLLMESIGALTGLQVGWSYSRRALRRTRSCSA